MRTSAFATLLMLLAVAHCGGLTNLLSTAQPKHLYTHNDYIGFALKYYFDTDGVVPRSYYLTCARIIKAVASADGTLSPKENEAFFAILRTSGASDDLLDQFEEIDTATVDVEAEVALLKGKPDVALN